MQTPKFNPGFRMSLFDGGILLAGIAGAILMGQKALWGGVVVAWVVLHFFCFCNVFRISRTPELIWSAAFVFLALPTMLVGLPGWPLTLGLSLFFSTALIWQETRQTHYHGIGWKRWNPGLPQWWENHYGESAG